MTETPVGQRQECVVVGWVPPPVLNGSRQKHWTTLRKEAEAAKIMAWSTAKQAGWAFMPGRVRLTVTFIFGVKRRRDADNTVARAKHLCDGLKGVFFEDDDIEHLDLVVRAEVVPGQKATRIELEALS